MTTGKNYHSLRKLLSLLDSEIKGLLAFQSTQIPVQLEISGNTEEEFEISFQNTKSKMIELSSAGNIAFIITSPMEVEEGEISMPLHLSYLSKDSAKEMLECIHSGVHPLLAHTREVAKEITHFYTNTYIDGN
jgi:YbbR domain-containing protein